MTDRKDPLEVFLEATTEELEKLDYFKAGATRPDNYRDLFTSRELEALLDTIKKAEKLEAVNKSSILSEADNVTGITWNKIHILFEEARQKNPKKYGPTDTTDEALIDAYGRFIYDFLLELFKDDLRDEEARTTAEAVKGTVVLFDANTYLTTFTETKHARQLRALGTPLPGQLQMTIDSKGNITGIKDPEKIKEAIKELQNVEGVNVELLELIGTAIEATILNGFDGPLSIPRAGIEETIGKQIYKPTKYDLNYIISGTVPENVDEAKFKANIEKHYDFWKDLLGLYKAGTVQTADGPFMLFNFTGYNSSDDTIECDSPYLRHVYEELAGTPILGPRKNDEPAYKITKTSHYIKPSIIKERNKATIEVTKLIDLRLKQRGIVSDAKKKPHLSHKDKRLITVDITYRDIINECPTLLSRLGPTVKEDGSTTIPTAADKRKKLERVILTPTTSNVTKRKCPKLEAVIRDHTELYNAYRDFKLTIDPISLKTLNRDGIHITHHGKNADYDKRPTLHAPELR